MPREKVERTDAFLRLEPVILEPVVDDGVTGFTFAAFSVQRHLQERLELLAQRA